MKSMYATLLSVALTGPAIAQIYKCPDASGRTVMQQMPCEGGAKIIVKPASGRADTASAGRDLAKVGAEASRQRQVNAGIAAGTPRIGMTIAELQQAMGAPNKVNQANHNGQQRDQAIFYRPNGTWYVYTLNGVVESMQFEESHAQSTGRRATTAWCPTGHELRNLEVSASSLTVTQAQLDELRRARDAARACGSR